MKTIEKAAFKPNCVSIPANGDDPTLLMLDGDNNYGEVFTSEAWESDGPPCCLRRYGKFVGADDGRVELLPDLYVVKIDERENWLDSVVLQRTKRLFGAYVFDRRQRFHLCSVSASHELYFLGSQWKEVEGLSEEDHDDLFERITVGDGQSESVTYWDRWDVDQMLATNCREGFLPTGASGGFALTGIKSVTTEDAIEEARESYQSSEF